MIIFDGNGEAISFNDDRSLDSRHTGQIKVYINGQVDRSLSLDWFHRLLALFPDVPGELKSGVIVAKFRDLPDWTRDRIWRGLQRVRIHIVDPRPHYRWVENMLRRIWKDDDAPQRLRRMSAEGNVPARFLISKQREIVAGFLINDSMAARVQFFGRALSNPFLMSEPPEHSLFSRGSRHDYGPLVTVGDFGHTEDRSLVRNIAQWSAKASAAFHSALDSVMDDTGQNDAMMHRFDIGRAIRARMIAELTQSHAFDKGNTRHIEILEHARHTMVDEFSANDRFYLMLGRRGRYVELESKDSYYVQAADFAAGIASDIYASENLIGVVGRFEYVTFNGRRLSRADAEEEMRKTRR